MHINKGINLNYQQYKGSCPLKMWTPKYQTWTTNGPKQCNPIAVHIKMWAIQGVHIKKCGLPSNMVAILRFVVHIRKMWTKKSTFLGKCGPQSPRLGTTNHKIYGPLAYINKGNQQDWSVGNITLLKRLTQPETRLDRLIDNSDNTIEWHS